MMIVPINETPYLPITLKFGQSETFNSFCDLKELLVSTEKGEFVFTWR